MDKNTHKRLMRRLNIEIAINILALVLAVIGMAAMGYLWYRIITHIF